MGVDKDEMLPIAADYLKAAGHYKRIARILQDAHAQMEFYDEEPGPEPLTPAQVSKLKAKLNQHKTDGDAARVAAETKIAD